MALYKLCPKCGCKIEYSKRYCDKCMSKVDDGTKHYDKTVRKSIDNKKYNDFYHSKEWNRLRQVAIVRQHGLDLYSYYILNKIEFAQTYHHIIPIKDDMSKKVDMNNIIGLTESNHQMVHQQYKINKGKMQKILFDVLEKWYNYIWIDKA